MAVRFTASTEFYSATTGLPTRRDTWTATFWTYISVDRDTFSAPFSLVDDLCMAGSDGTTLRFIPDDTFSQEIIGQNMSVGAWYRVAVIRNGATGKLIMGPEGGALQTFTDTTWPTNAAVPGSMRIGNTNFGDWLDGRVSGFKLWNAALSDAEVVEELKQKLPVRTSGILRVHKFTAAETTDYSGNGATLSGGTGTSTEADPANLPDSLTVVHAVAATFAGAGALSATARQTFTGGATFTGAGSMLATARVGRTAQATFAGSGSLTAAAARVQPAAVTLAGAGVMTADATRSQPAAATFTGAGSMLANAGELGAATFAGAGVMTVAVRQQHTATATFTGAGQMATAARSTQRVATAFVGSGSMLVDARRVQPAIVAFAGSGQMLADGRRVHPAQAVFVGAGSLTTTGIRVRPGAATFAGAGQFTASARVARPGLNVSLWAVLDDDVLAPLAVFTNLELSRERNNVGSIAVDYPAATPGFAHLRAAVKEDRPVEVEVWPGGSRDGAYRGLVTRSEGDDLDGRSVWRFAGTFLEVILGDAIVYPQPAPAENGELRFDNRNAGHIVLTVLQQAQARGVLTGLTRDWTTSVDSSGQPWPATIAGLKYSPKTTLLAILKDLVDKDLCEFEVTKDRVLRVWAPDRRGTDRTTGAAPTLFRWGRVSGAPIRHSTEDTVTAVLAVGADGLSATASDPSAEARIGRRVEVGVDAGNLDNQGALLAYAQAALLALTKGQEEIRHPLTFGPGDPRPGAGYELADRVLSERSGGARRGVDVQQWTLTASRQRATGGEVVLNDLIASRLQRLARQVDRITSGGAVIGTSESNPITDVTPPAAPDVNTFVISSIAYQDSEHSQTLAAVTIGWAPVTTDAAGPSTERAQAAQLILERMQSGQPIAEDWTWVGAPPIVGVHNDALLALYEDSGSTDPQTWLAGYVSANSSGAVATDDVAGYKVQLAYLGLSQVGGIPSSNPVDEIISYNDVTPSNGIPQTSYTFGGVEAGANIGVRVAAFDSSGNQSAWSTPIGHDTETDNIAPPIPSTPTARDFLRQLIVEWDGLGSAGEVMPRDFDYVEVHASMASTFTPDATTLFDRLYGQGGVVYDPGSYVGTVYFVLVSVDRSGNRSVASEVASATPARAIADDIGDQIIDAAKLSDGAVLGPKIAPEAVSTPHLSVATFSDNLLPNGGFEDTSLTTALPASWLVATTSGGTNTFTRTDTAADVFSGAAAAQVNMSAASGRLDLTSDTIPTKPGDNWYFELSAKASRAISGLTVYLGVGGVDSTTSYPAGYTFPFLASLTPLTTSYPGAPLGLNYTVPATVGAGVVPRYLRLYLRFGDVAGDAGAVTFFVDEVRARKVVGTAEIQDAAISRAKIGLLAVGDGQFESASVGKLLTGTMTATVTNSGLFRTAATGNRVEFDSAGLRLYQGTTVVGRWQTSDASMLMTGTYMSALSGERINIFTDGTLRFYPQSGTNYSQIANFGNDLVMRGVMDGNGRSGRVNANAQGVGINFSAESEIPSNLRSEMAVFDRRARITAPLMDFQLNGKLAASDGGTRRATFSQTSENGANLPITYVSYRTSGASGHGGIEGNGGGIKFVDGHVEVVDGTLNSFREIFATAFTPASSATVKEGIRDLRSEFDALAVIRNARSKRWTYTWERWRTGDATEEDPVPVPVEVEPPVRFGPIAEDLPPILQVPISNPMGPGKTLGVSLGDQIGVLWAAIGQMEDQQTLSVTGRGVVTSGQLRSGDTVRVAVLWDETPLAVPTDVTALALPAMPTATGRVSARVDPATVTTGGCEVVLSVSGTIPVVVTAALPIGVEVIGRYLYRPPYIPGEEAA